MLYDAGLWAAAGFGLVALLMGNRTAAPLLASFIVSTALCAFGAFNVALWLLIDAVVVGCIIAGPTTRVDRLVVALFPPAWFAYFFLDEPWLGFVTWAVVVGQFLLVFPWARVCRGLRGAAGDFVEKDDFDLCTRA